MLDRRDEVLAVNEALLQFEENKVFVEVETAPHEYEKRYVETGLSDGINIEVLSGLGQADKLLFKWSTPVPLPVEKSLVSTEKFKCSEAVLRILQSCLPVSVFIKSSPIVEKEVLFESILITAFPP